MNTSVVLPSSINTPVPIEPVDVQIGVLLLFFAGCILVIALLSFFLFGGAPFLRAWKWICSVACAKVCLKCCCPSCCRRSYQRVINWSEDLMSEESEEEIL